MKKLLDHGFFFIYIFKINFIVVKTEFTGKISEAKRIEDIVHVWSDGGHSTII